VTPARIVKELRLLIATGFWEWDQRAVSHLPPGAWLRRTAATGTVLDGFDPTYIHPLLALSVYRGRADASEERSRFMQVAAAQATFLNALTFWGQALNMTRGEAAQWFYVFTPPVGLIPREMVALAERLDDRRQEVWDKLGLRTEVLTTNLLALDRDWPPTATRPNFWTQEVKLR